MSKNQNKEVESVFNHLNTVIFAPMFENFKTSENKPVVQCITMQDKLACYTYEL